MTLIQFLTCTRKLKQMLGPFTSEMEFEREISLEKQNIYTRADDCGKTCTFTISCLVKHL